MNRKHDTGKGDKYRPVDFKKWDKNWEKVFSKDKKTKVKKSKKENNK